MQQLLESKVTPTVTDFKIAQNKTRRDFLAAYVVALVLCRQVQFHETAEFLNSDAKLASNTTRIQDMYREVEFDYLALGLLLYSLLPRKGKLRLTIDRTGWEFGKAKVNILALMVGVGNFQMPLFWEVLDNKGGNSSTSDRIDLLKLALQVIPVERIGIFLGDREFIGEEWVSFLKQEGIAFIFRFPKHHHITRADGAVWTVEQVLKAYPKGVQWTDCMVNGVWGNVDIRPTKDKDDPLFVFGTVKVNLLAQLYRKRWKIEALFQNLKKRGFNLENSHMKHLERLKKLFGMIVWAYGLCLSLGLYRHHKEKNITKKNHGYKANSFFRHGLDYIKGLFSQKKPGYLEELWTMVREAAIFIQDEYEVAMDIETDTS